MPLQQKFHNTMSFLRSGLTPYYVDVIVSKLYETVI